MFVKRYKQYLSQNFVISASVTDIYETGEDLLRYADEIQFGEDFMEMRMTLTELDTGEGDLGNHVRLVNGIERNGLIRSRSFCDNYMRVFNGGFRNWRLVRVEIGPEGMKLYYMRFTGDDGLCDEYEVLEIRYPEHIAMEISLNTLNGDDILFTVIAGNAGETHSEVTVEEYCAGTLLRTRRIMEDEDGVFAEITEEDPACQNA